MPEFTLSDIRPAEYRKAYALAVMTGEGLAYDDWVADLQRHWLKKQHDQAGVARLLRSDGYMYGLIFYEIVGGSRCGTALEVSRLILPDGLESMKAEVIEMLDGFAHAHGCDAIHMGKVLPEGNASGDIKNLFQDGFQYTPAHWCRRLKKH